MVENRFDLLVIGGGPAGTAGALAASSFGKSVGVIERAEWTGGAGTNTGTIPSKTLRESALVISGWRARRLLGVDVSVKREASLAEFTHHARQVSAAERNRVEGRMRETGVTKIRGQARFRDAHSLEVTHAGISVGVFSADVILIAPGSAPVRPSLFPFEHPRVHDSDEILSIAELPKSLAVVGAGVIGAEYASTFAALGVTVHLIDGRDTLLPFLDSDVSLAIMRGMEARGVNFHWRERVEQCVGKGTNEVEVSLTSGKTLTVSDVLVAAGRQSNTADLNLAACGVTAGERGLLKVDEHYRTEVPHIYAAGDVIGAPALAATSMEQARVAMLNAFNLISKSTSSLLPTGIYTIPEASMAGETEQALKTKGTDYLVGRANYSDNPRGQIVGDPDGFLKLLFARDTLKLLGVHAVGEQATELVHPGLIALHCGATAELFSNVCFNYPTLGDLYKYACYDAMLRMLKRRT